VIHISEMIHWEDSPTLYPIINLILFPQVDKFSYFYIGANSYQNSSGRGKVLRKVLPLNAKWWLYVQLPISVLMH